MVHVLIAALLSLFPRYIHRECIAERRAQIIDHAETAARQVGVPPGLLLVVGFLESHWGCHRASGGCWGAPIDPQHRHTAGTPVHAARALRTSYGVCGSWEGAVARFRCGLCRCPQRTGYTAAYTVRVAARMYALAGQPLPDNFYAPPARRLSRR